MEREFRRGFQDVIKNDPYHIEERLQEYCSDLSILYNPDTNQWRVMDGDYCVMVVPYDMLDDRTYWHMRKIDKHNGFDVSKELRDNEEKMERENEKKVEDMAYWMAKDLRRPLIEAHDYNRW